MNMQFNSKVSEAIEALRKFHDPGDSRACQSLFPEIDNILQISFVLKKVPTSVDGIKTVRVRLPCPFRTESSTSICLLVKDVDNDKWGSDVDVSSRHYKEKLMWEYGVKSIDEVIALRQLKREYKTYEAKRKLCSAYDLFLVDSCVQPLVARNLGKSFHAQNKLPLPVHLKKKKLSEQIEDALATTSLYLKKATTRCCLNFANLNQSDDQIKKNFETVITKLKTCLPGSWENIRSMYISSAKSPILPIYASLDSANMVVLPAPVRKRGQPVVDEVSTLNPDSKLHDNMVRVYPDGRVQLLSKDGVEMKSKLDQQIEATMRIKTSVRANKQLLMSRKRGSNSKKNNVRSVVKKNFKHGSKPRSVRRKIKRELKNEVKEEV